MLVSLAADCFLASHLYHLSTEHQDSYAFSVVLSDSYVSTDGVTTICDRASAQECDTRL